VNKIGLRGSPTQVVRIFPPTPRGQREILSGTVEEQVATLAKKLKEQSLI
jgi:electron transfer flavoprotein beta subunit